jgi:hypothetical protein
MWRRNDQTLRAYAAFVTSAKTRCARSIASLAIAQTAKAKIFPRD